MDNDIAAAPPRELLAVDLGAESGRVVLGRLWTTTGRLEIEEIHRFPNGPVPLFGSLRWEVLGLFREILAGLRLAAKRAPNLAGVSVDSWGVDYALMRGADAPLLAPPHCYRDGRTAASMAALHARPGKEALWAETGVQFQFFNTLYQLHAERRDHPGLLAAAESFLPIADCLHHLLGGLPRVEESMASTTQLYDGRRRAWSPAMRDLLGLPASFFPPVVPSGTPLGPLRDDLAVGAGFPAGQVQVIATCSHDTAAAVAAVPAIVDEDGKDGWAYLSSGTWSLLGVELTAPRFEAAVRTANFTNEIGFGGSVRFLKNIAGLWILQELRREWARDAEGRGSGDKAPSYSELVRLAGETEPFRSLIHPDAARFGRPGGGMAARVVAFCHETGQPPPETPGQFARCVFESLALTYAHALDEAERLTDRRGRVRTLHVVGGGSQNAFLNQCTADATGRRVLAGPAEATAIGNLLVQAVALGDLPSLAALRGVVARSFPPTPFHPRGGDNSSLWRAAAARHERLHAVQD